jgi:triosephosphate isomerase
MNGLAASSRALAQAIARDWRSTALASVDVIVCPPHVYLGEVARELSGSPVALGAPAVSSFPEGAHTGDVAVAMLRDVGCAWTIVGHSERRTGHAESDMLVADKARAALAGGLGVIACVGETLQERESGVTATVIDRQLQPLLAVMGQGASPEVMVAYEPVWAIGTGRTATPAQAAEVHGRIRGSLAAAGLDAASIRILYGGSVKPSSTAALLASPDIDGALVGGASLDASDFLAIGRSALAA